MEKYMFIFKGASDGAAKLTQPEMLQHNQIWYKWIKDLTEKKIYLSGEPLDKGGKIVSKLNNSVKVTDGPFPEAKELVGGYFIISAGSLDEAAEIAKASPGLDLGGSVEIRQVMKIEM